MPTDCRIIHVDWVLTMLKAPADAGVIEANKTRGAAGADADQGCRPARSQARRERNSCRLRSSVSTTAAKRATMVADHAPKLANTMLRRGAVKPLARPLSRTPCVMSSLISRRCRRDNAVSSLTYRPLTRARARGGLFRARICWSLATSVWPRRRRSRPLACPCARDAQWAGSFATSGVDKWFMPRSRPSSRGPSGRGP